MSEIDDETPEAEVWTDVPDDAPSYEGAYEVAQVTPTIAVTTFEGALVTEAQGKLPGIVLGMDEGYARGMHLRLNLEVRVKSIRYEENKQGDMIRQHVFAIESAEIVSAFRPEDAYDGVGGSASGAPEPTPEDVEELGIRIGRTAEKWA